MDDDKVAFLVANSGDLLAGCFKGIVIELSLIRKQIEKLDRTIAKLNEAPVDAVVQGKPSQEE